MLEEVYFTVLYAPVTGIKYLRTIISIASTEGIIIFILHISNEFRNTILSNPEEIVYFSLPHLYLEWFKRKWTKHPLLSHNSKELCTKTNKSTKEIK